MSDYTLPPCSTLICGMTGSGKTTFALRALLNTNCACCFVFDDLGQASARLNKPLAGTAAELEAALPSRFVLFNPHRMFPGDVDKAFAFFCDWVYQASQRGSGKKILLVDEVWRFCSPHSIPKELATVAQCGRAENLELMVATQMPHKVHASITGQATELVCFRLQEPLALSRVQELGLDAQGVSTLPLGQFQALNRLTGTQLSGKVF